MMMVWRRRGGNTVQHDSADSRLVRGRWCVRRVSVDA